MATTGICGETLGQQVLLEPAADCALDWVQEPVVVAATRLRRHRRCSPRPRKRSPTRASKGTAGGGAVRIQMSGDQKITGITIQPDVVDPDDVEMLQDLIMAAIGDASERANEIQQKSFGSITGGLDLSALGLG